ncbi:hypothetical protein LSTR_LSTR010296 [Laodelphax striatellus]|uniref:Uncharacterized protein n=1 Tax=Laodelphax striatellus TaxID=195883 RepID=A0A482XQP6_LAOST|nr:hypothetical protein LSTR_LSTR010296 [Laodelphax striatellus]
MCAKTGVPTHCAIIICTLAVLVQANVLPEQVIDPVNDTTEPQHAAEDLSATTNNHTTLLLQPVASNLSFTTTKLHLKKTCQQEYSSGCLKLDLIRMMDKLESSGPLELLPGVTLVRAPPLDAKSLNAAAALPDSESPRLDNYLYKRVNSYLKSLSLNVQILDSNILNKLKRFGQGATELFAPETNSVTGRKKNRNWQAFWLAGLLSAGTMLAMGMSTLSAMAGKALMTSLLALVLAGFAALKGHQDDKKTTTYEIITRPIYTHGHKHGDALADAQMMAPTHGHTHHMQMASGAPSYTYRRSIDFGRPATYSYQTDYSTPSDSRP